MAVGIAQLETQPMPVLHAQRRLERVVVAVRRVSNLIDAGKPLVGPVEVCVCSGGDLLPVHHIADRQGIECQLNVLVPGGHANVLDQRDGGWSQFSLYTQAELSRGRARILVVSEGAKAGREKRSLSSLPGLVVGVWI